MRSPRCLFAALLVLAVALAGCHEPSEVDQGTGPGDGDPAFPGTLAMGQHSGHTAGFRALIADAEAWTAFWEGHTPKAMMPNVDFDTHRVVAVVLEDRPDGCHHVRITGLARIFFGDSLEVEVTEHVPTSDMACTDVITQPNHIIAVEWRPLSVTFTDRVVEGGPEE